MNSFVLIIYPTMKTSFIPPSSTLSVMTSSIWKPHHSSDKSPNMPPFKPSEILHWTHIPTYYPIEDPYIMPSTGTNIWTTYHLSDKPSNMK